MSNLLERFQSMPPGANASIFLRDLAVELDAIAANIKALPQYNPAAAPMMQPADIGTWTKALNAANGWGDVMNRLRGMAESVDSINDWITCQQAQAAWDAAPKVDIPEDAKMAITPLTNQAVVDRMAKARAAKAAKHAG